MQAGTRDAVSLRSGALAAEHCHGQLAGCRSGTVRKTVTALLSCNASGGAGMAKVAPKQQALHGRHRRSHRDPAGVVHTFGFHRGRGRILGVICLGLGTTMLAVLVMVLVTGQIGNEGMRTGGLSAGESAAWDVILFTGVGLFLLWVGIRAFRGLGRAGQWRKLIIHNELLTRRVDTGDIARSAPSRNRKRSAGATHWVARVKLTDGKSIWIDNFDGGTTRRPPRPQLAATVDEIRALLG